MVVKQPQDHKKKKDDAGRSEFRFPVGDKEIVVPPFAEVVTAGFIRKNREKSMQDVMFLLLEEILDEDSLELFDSLNLDRMREFGDKWQSEAGVELPESSAS